MAAAARQQSTVAFQFCPECEQSLQKVDLAQDPTLPRTRSRICPRCDKNEAVFFQSTSKMADSMVLYFACVDCGHRWKDTDIEEEAKQREQNAEQEQQGEGAGGFQFGQNSNNGQQQAGTPELKDDIKDEVDLEDDGDLFGDQGLASGGGDDTQEYMDEDF
ncbi:hypothetical protein SmJEL517_g02538 [Synchytrium microbalum]|uniref:DNA-directed RNA polymerase II subunit RPB9 n=1 Tax=Synchytrium microbalum TaxID=1806994 RepID=A0A507C6S2_9FUNG|nr:uncharacterized protein SmJEL517_g02538 [Synchytrium microbalum]TPX34819.1 hypothetical protein SmJEL517_g02538 [Synchytrium microbalum]